MIEKYGWENMLSAVGAKLIQKDTDDFIGELWRWKEPDNVMVQILRVKNGTPDPITGGDKWYSIRVPLNFNRAIDAHRNTYPVTRHLNDDDYRVWNQSRA